MHWIIANIVSMMIILGEVMVIFCRDVVYAMERDLM